MIPGTRLRSDCGRKHLFQNSVSVRVNQYTPDTNEHVMWTSLLITVSGIPYVSDFIDERPENVFFKKLKTLLESRRTSLSFREHSLQLSRPETRRRDGFWYSLRTLLTFLNVRQVLKICSVDECLFLHRDGTRTSAILSGVYVSTFFSSSLLFVFTKFP